MAGVLEHCISHYMEIFYDLSIFGGCLELDTKTQSHISSKPWNWKGLSAISVISQGNVWDLCTVLDVEVNQWVCVWLCVDIYDKYCTYTYRQHIFCFTSSLNALQPKCYQIILLSLTCPMIDCTGQCESAAAQWVNQTFCCTLLSHCLMPDNFAHKGRVLALNELSLLSACNISRII
jgi:hypothetical protein